MSSEPTWQLILDAAHSLTTRLGTFGLADIVRDVQKVDRSRGRGTIQPKVQGMTVNAGTRTARSAPIPPTHGGL